MKHRTTHTIAAASAKAGFSRATGQRILRQRESLPPPSRGRRRPDPLAGIFEEEVVPILEQAPAIRAVAVFRELERRHPGLPAGVRRTLERRIRNWRALHGAEREVMFPQRHEAGRLGLSDFTRLPAGLGITVAGQPLACLLYHFRLAWSGYCHVAVVLGGESFTALSSGLQNALRALGGAPREHRTDSLSAAFCNLRTDPEEDLARRYAALCGQYGMKSTRNNRGLAHENGSIESPHGHLKREIADALALRGSTEFADLEAFRRFVAGIAGRLNALRGRKIEAERKVLAPLPAFDCAAYEETGVRVTRSSGFILRQVFYTVPSRLIGHRLQARLYDDRVELFVSGAYQLTLPRGGPKRPGNRSHVVNYRHVIHSLKRKPGALARLACRDQLFPREAYRRCFEQALAALSERQACRLTVQLLALAHEANCEAALAAAIDDCLQAGRLPDLDALQARFAPDPGAMPAIRLIPGQLANYAELHRSGVAS